MRKKIVPSHEERIATLGDPKTPKMGSITPKTVEVPQVEDLIAKIKAATPPPMRIPMEMPSMPRYMWTSFDLGTEVTAMQARDRMREREYGETCTIRCQCPPCRHGDCGRCDVEEYARRHRDDERGIREIAIRYRRGGREYK